MNAARATFRLIDRKEVIRAALQDPSTVLLEASPLEEFDERHLPGARRIDYWHEMQQVARLVTNPRNNVIVYCRGESACHAEQAAVRLLELGYERLAVYAGGKLDWERGGLAFERTAHVTDNKPGDTASDS